MIIYLMKHALYVNVLRHDIPGKFNYLLFRSLSKRLLIKTRYHQCKINFIFCLTYLFLILRILSFFRIIYIIITL